MLKVLLTNARSLSPKISSLHTAFDEHELNFALVTESWLKDSEVLNRDIIDLENGTGLGIIYKNRPRTGIGARKVGGGVSIVFNKASCNLRERRVSGNKFELVVATGRIGFLPRKVAIFCVYIEPRMKVEELKDLNELIGREILAMKVKDDPFFFIGGDLNHRSLGDALDDFPEIVRANHEPTRGPACLDVLYSNFNLNESSWPPLHTRDGTPSDHICVVLSGAVETKRNFTWLKKTARKHSDQAVAAFAEEMRHADWDQILPSNQGPDELVEKFETHVAEAVDRLFPLRTVRHRSNEKPWITNRIRKLGLTKRRVYKREGKSQLWHAVANDMAEAIETSVGQYVDGIEKQNNTRAYFDAVKKIANPNAPAQWSVLDLFPGMTPAEAGERTACFFTKITDTFVPLQPRPGNRTVTRRPLTVDEVASKLKAANKPNSSVKGDVLPRLMKTHHALFAAPVTTIFNAVFRTNEWPSAWKNETTVIIPKVNNPESLAQCRNISCTPFLSKVLEMFILEDLRAEIPLDPVQYGGVKGCSVDHLLVDMLDNILRPMEGGNASVVLGIDFEKAFNRLDHGECLRQLERLGASGPSLELIRSFLTNRSMQVKIGSSLTDPKPLQGGSPQGSILGCYLYCATTQLIAIRRPDPRGVAPLAPPGQPPQRQARTSQTSLQSDTSPGSGFNLLGDALPEEGNDSNTSDDGFMTAGSDNSTDSIPDYPDVAPTVVMFKYVDDTTTVETVPRSRIARHVAGLNPTAVVDAGGTNLAISNIIDIAEAINMRVNCAKTQVLCITPDDGYRATTTINAGGEAIVSTPTMKLLGFMLGEGASAAPQVAAIKTKFRARLWMLVHLRRAGIRGLKLFRLYSSLVRPVIESNAVVYHSLLTRGQTAEIERLQKQAVRLCYGFGIPYLEASEVFCFSTLEARREMAVRRFVAKTIASNPRFSSKWFVRREVIDIGLRQRRPYIENRARTERYRKSPLVHFQKIANDIMTC